jgi:hypothetical protein
MDLATFLARLGEGAIKIDSSRATTATTDWANSIASLDASVRPARLESKLPHLSKANLLTTVTLARCAQLLHLGHNTWLTAFGRLGVPDFLNTCLAEVWVPGRSFFLSS